MSPPLFFLFFFFLMIRRPPRSTLSSSSAASDVYKRQAWGFHLPMFAEILEQWTRTNRKTEVQRTAEHMLPLLWDRIAPVHNVPGFCQHVLKPMRKLLSALQQERWEDVSKMMDSLGVDRSIRDRPPRRVPGKASGLDSWMATSRGVGGGGGNRAVNAAMESWLPLGAVLFDALENAARSPRPGPPTGPESAVENAVGYVGHFVQLDGDEFWGVARVWRELRRGDVVIYRSQDSEMVCTVAALAKIQGESAIELPSVVAAQPGEVIACQLVSAQDGGSCDSEPGYLLVDMRDQ
eukprot:TRINITY_DN9653_c0_g2_i1.p1 TRINITY_DN9653_c0_g2~~TRINITY_DN9653_c0_g2_i1.p1  ORF type:complete len:293 (+),score=38.68 TRINITY_DN9653_c0_g2_i1:104-982(+)